MPAAVHGIEEHMAKYEQQLSRVTACAPPLGLSCPAHWVEEERVWRLGAARAERARLLRHARAVGQLLSSSSVTFTDKRWKPLVPWEPGYSCGDAARRFPERGDIVVGKYGKAQPDDGAKWLCGP
eukprot:7238127-Prymnesium_polylepis.1